MKQPIPARTPAPWNVRLKLYPNRRYRSRVLEEVLDASLVTPLLWYANSARLTFTGASMGADPCWLFPYLNGGEESGLNEAGIESFKRADSLGRETVQNILDHPDGSGLPRIAEFDYIDLPASEFPGLAEFTNVFTGCRDFVLPQLKGKKVGNEEKFFAEGLKVLSSSTIPVLRIGDLNTTGLVGADLDRDKPFFRLLRGQGFSTTEGKGGGTYGIGQRAPFAYSALRTVLYS